MAQSYKNNFIVGAQDIYRKAFCERSFASWDFSVTGINSLKNRFEANSSQLKVYNIGVDFALSFMRKMYYDYITKQILK